MPESYVGIISAHEEDSLAKDVKRFREKVQNRQHSLFQDDVKKEDGRRRGNEIFSQASRMRLAFPFKFSSL